MTHAPAMHFGIDGRPGSPSAGRDLAVKLAITLVMLVSAGCVRQQPPSEPEPSHARRTLAHPAHATPESTEPVRSGPCGWTSEPGMGAGIRGAVVDERTGEPVVGATIVATGPALQGSQTAIALEPDASYEVRALPAGVYEVTVYFGDSITRFRGVPVETNRVTTFRVRIDSVGPRDVVVRATPKVPCADGSRWQSWHLIQASR